MIIFHSYKFAPGHCYLLKAVIESLPAGEKFAVSLDKKYFQFDPNLKEYVGEYYSRGLHCHLNSSIFTLVKLIIQFFLRQRSVFVLHEPILNVRDKAGEYKSVRKKIFIFAVKLYNDLCCIFASRIALLSNNAKSNLPHRFIGKAVQVPHLFEDAKPNDDDLFRSEDVFIVSYIGTVAEDHGFQDFLQWAQSSTLCSARVHFRIVTGSTIPPSILGRLDESISVTSGSFLSTEEIHAAFRDSHFVWCGYRSANQSGVLPVALMFGAVPLVSSAFGDSLRGSQQSMLYIADVTPKVLDDVLGASLSNYKMCSRKARNLYKEMYCSKTNNWNAVLSRG